MLLATDGRQLPQLPRFTKHRPLATVQTGEMFLNDYAGKVGDLCNGLDFGETLDS